MMSDHDAVHARPVQALRRFYNRRRFLAHAGGAVALAGISACGNEDSPLAGMPTPTPTGASPTPTASPTTIAVTDADLLNLALQLTYLEAEFYSRAVLGAPLSADLTAGAGARGATTGPRPVSFVTATLADQFREIAVQEIAQVQRLRTLLGAQVTAAPAMDLSSAENGPFTRLARESRYLAAPALFDPYANEDNFLLAAFVLKDIVVSAWKSFAPLFVENARVGAAGGFLGTQAMYAGLIRSQLYLRGAATGSKLREATNQLSDRRDFYSSGLTDDDQGVASGNGLTAANITPADGAGLGITRGPQLTLNVVYLSLSGPQSGGFFPSGVNGGLKQGAQF